MVNLTLKDYILYRCIVCHSQMFKNDSYCECLVEQGIFCDKVYNELSLAEDYEKICMAKNELNLMLDLQKKKDNNLKDGEENF